MQYMPLFWFCCVSPQLSLLGSVEETIYGKAFLISTWKIYVVPQFQRQGTTYIFKQEENISEFIENLLWWRFIIHVFHSLFITISNCLVHSGTLPQTSIKITNSWADPYLEFLNHTLCGESHRTCNAHICQKWIQRTVT